MLELGTDTYEKGKGSVDNITIPVKLTERDVKKMALESQWGKLETKITLVVWVLLVFAVIFILPSFAASISDSLMDAFPSLTNSSSSDIVTNALFILFVTTAIGFARFDAPVRMRVKLLQKSPILQETRVVDWGEEGFRVYTCQRMEFCRWEEVYRIEEYASGFYVRLSSLWMLPIPRRCFENTAQLSAFFELITTSVTANKLFLKNRPLGISSPDAMPDDISLILKNASDVSKTSTAKTSTIEESKDAPLLSIQYHISKNEYVSGCMQMTFLHPLRVFLVLVGLWMLITSIVSLFASSAVITSLTIPIFSVVLGFVISIFIPLQQFFSSRKTYETDARLKQEMQIELFADGICFERGDSRSKYVWEDIKMIKNHPQFLEIYISPVLAFLLPKRAFASREDWQQIIARKRQYDGFKVKP
jgi:hypothetical protein